MALRGRVDTIVIALRGVMLEVPTRARQPIHANSIPCVLIGNVVQRFAPDALLAPMGAARMPPTRADTPLGCKQHPLAPATTEHHADLSSATFRNRSSSCFIAHTKFGFNDRAICTCYLIADDGAGTLTDRAEAADHE